MTRVKTARHSGLRGYFARITAVFTALIMVVINTVLGDFSMSFINTRRRHLVAGLSLAAVAATAAGACAATNPAPILGPLLRITSGSPFFACTADNKAGQIGINFGSSIIEPWLAVDPTKPGHLLSGQQQDRWSNGGARGLDAGLSTDGGKHWKITIPNGISLCSGGRLPRASDAWTGFGGDGTAYFFSLAFSNTESAMLASRSTDGGLTWAAPVAVIDDTDPLAFNDKNSLTADTIIHGNAYTVWDRGYNASGGRDNGEGLSAGGDGVQRARDRLTLLRLAARGDAPALAAIKTQTSHGPTYFSRTTDSGLTWSKAVPIYDPGANAQTIGNVVVEVPSGEIFDFFTKISAAGNLTIAFVRSTDHGATWSKIPQTAAVMAGNGPVTPDLGKPMRTGDIIPSIAADPATGALYVAWQDKLAGSTTLGLLFTQSTDDGKTWSAPVRINQTPASTANPLRAQAFNGAIVATTDGTLVATYYDFRNDTATGELADVWALTCKPNTTAPCSVAANWGREMRLTKASFDVTQAPLTSGGYFLGDYFGLAAQGRQVWPAFTATVSAGHSALFTRPITLP